MDKATKEVLRERFLELIPDIMSYDTGDDDQIVDELVKCVEEVLEMREDDIDDLIHLDGGGEEDA